VIPERLTFVFRVQGLKLTRNEDLGAEQESILGELVVIDQAGALQTDNIPSKNQ
jgi:hypothetical protein